MITRWINLLFESLLIWVNDELEQWNVCWSQMSECCFGINLLLVHFNIIVALRIENRYKEISGCLPNVCFMSIFRKGSNVLHTCWYAGNWSTLYSPPAPALRFVSPLNFSFTFTLLLLLQYVLSITFNITFVALAPKRIPKRLHHQKVLYLYSKISEYLFLWSSWASTRKLLVPIAQSHRIQAPLFAFTAHGIFYHYWRFKFGKHFSSGQFSEILTVYFSIKEELESNLKHEY